MGHRVQLVAIADIRVNKKQVQKISKDKVNCHLRSLASDEELYPVDLHALGDGTFTIAGNGRHRYFAYLYSGYTHVPAIVHH
jgi:hypothetical protein